MTPEEPRQDPSRRSLTDYVAEALAKIETEEGHAELERQHELVEAEAQRRCVRTSMPGRPTGRSSGVSPDAPP